jgi:hypothetical protein
MVNRVPEDAISAKGLAVLLTPQAIRTLATAGRLIKTL